MSETSDNSIKIELPDLRGELVFETPQKLLEWQEQLRTDWQWLGNLPPREAWSQQESQLNRIKQAGEEWRRHYSNSETRGEARNRVSATIQQMFRADNPLFGNEARSSFIKDVLRNHGQAAAAGVFAVFSHASNLYMGSNVSESFFRGVLRAFLFDEEIDWTASTHRELLEELEGRYKKQMSDQDIRLQQLDSENQRLNAAYESTLKLKSDGLDELSASKSSVLDGLHSAKEAALNELHAAQEKAFVELAAKHEANLKAIEDTFHNKLALQKPIDYWREKKTLHVKLSKRFAWASAAALLLLGSALSCLVYGTFGGLEPDQNPKHWQVGITIVAAFFVIWIVRLLIRMLLSHQHLASDAAERVTMVQTYLSLSREGQGVAPADRAVILQQLFKSASDGLVKDDGAPPGWLELFSRQK